MHANVKYAMKEGTVCEMCHGTGDDGCARSCCWCLGKGIVPSAQERRLGNKPSDYR